MSNDERTRVIELLRCAADLGLQGEACPLTAARDHLGADKDIAKLADNIAMRFHSPIDHGDPSGHWKALGADCLEAARQIEEGRIR